MGPHVLIFGLDAVPKIRNMFYRYRCDWMAALVGKYSTMMEDPPLLTTLVRDISIDRSEEMVRWVLYGPNF